MKIIKILAAIFLALPFFLTAQTVTVTSPNGNESWGLNTLHNITWNFQNAGNAKVDIILRNSGGKVGVIKSQVALSAGTWPWSFVGKLEDGTMVSPGTNYVVRIRNTANTITDDSNNPFSITGAPPPPQAGITVTSPASGDKWNRSKTYTIAWTKAGTMPNAVKISLMDKNSASVVREIADGVANSGSCPWPVPQDVAFGDYRVRVLVKTTDIKDDSDTFAIAMAKIPHTPTAIQKKLYSPAQAEPCPDCDKYEEKPQITNWGSPHNHSDAAIMEVYKSRSIGYPQGADYGSFAHVGYDYFLRPDTSTPAWTTYCYRSRIWVNMVKFQNLERSGRRLVAAKLHLKQFNSLIVGDSNASCAVGLAVFLAPWTNFWNFQITHQGTGGLNFGSTDYSVDITEIVRKWLDETWPHCGLLLTSQEVDWGQQAKTCYSSYYVNMTLWFKKD